MTDTVDNSVLAKRTKTKIEEQTEKSKNKEKIEEQRKQKDSQLMIPNTKMIKPKNVNSFVKSEQDEIRIPRQE